MATVRVTRRVHFSAAHRLHNPAFSDDAFAAFYRHSGGIPRKLNMLAGRVLLHGAVEDLRVIDGAFIISTGIGLWFATANPFGG